MKNKQAKKSIVELCTNHTGKMQNMVSINTSVKLNTHCRERAKNPLTICHKCYSDRQLSYQKSTAEKYARNTEVLTSRILDFEELPVLNVLRCRFEAFGDLNNEIQAQNYLNICRKNPGTTFALWTKNPFYIDRAFKKFGGSKPKNIIIIFSSIVINKPANFEALQRLFPFIDKMFTVFKNEDAAKASGMAINCGARNCFTCGRCYSKKTGKYVNELLK